MQKNIKGIIPIRKCTEDEQKLIQAKLAEFQDIFDKNRS